MKPPVFLTLAEVIEIHNNQVKLFGGQEGIRELHLLQSAIAQPEAIFGGQWLHAGLFEMAAAYTFHICRNHPFMDGKKRTALVAGLVFLEINRKEIHDPNHLLLSAMERMAAGRMSSEEFARLLCSLAEK